MARSNQYNPNQAGFDMMKFCQQARAQLKGRLTRVDVADTPEYQAYVQAVVNINAMDYNELRAALRA